MGSKFTEYITRDGETIQRAMSAVRPAHEKIIAIITADIHLSSKPPVWRSPEKDWYAAMGRPLKELNQLQAKFNCPVLIAGDIFDKWFANPELINFALHYLPDCIAIPGQHDMPLHNYGDMDRSAYRTLEIAGRLDNLPVNNALWQSEFLSIKGFPYGFPLQPADSNFGGLKVALIHEYRWVKGATYPGAPKEKQFGKRIAGVDDDGKWYGYDVVIYGDNHKGFDVMINNTVVFNCGGFMRRRSDELAYQPRVGLLRQDGLIETYKLNCIDDVHLSEISSKIIESLDMEDFVNSLMELKETSLDFKEAVKQYLLTNKVPAPIKKIILKSMEV